MNAINNPQSANRIAAPVLDAVQSASARSGIDFDYLFDVARVESGYNPAAQARPWFAPWRSSVASPVCLVN